MINHIKEKTPVNVKEVEDFAAKINAPYFTLFDEAYPKDWKQLYLPPLVCFYEGNIELLSDLDKSVTYVGSRDASKEGLSLAFKFGKELAKNGVTIVSGLARGIDYEVMRGAMEEKGKIIGISGAGINIDYPSSSKNVYDYVRRSGLLLSEYPFNAKPSKQHFPLRNRLLAATGKITVIGEAEHRSGTCITASNAINLGKDVGCLPFLADKDSEANALIKDGAYLIDSVNDILNLLNENKNNFSSL